MKYDAILGKGFYAWQPSTWPAPASAYNEEFNDTLRTIFQESMLAEIKNVIEDAPSLGGRGHVVALSILCAIDAVSAYAFQNLKKDMCVSCGRTDKVGPRYKKYIGEFFPHEYQPFSDKLYRVYRNSITHSWNLFEAGMLPGNEPIREVNCTLEFGLRHFYGAFEMSVNTFLDRLSEDQHLQATALHRYRELKRTARP